MFSMRLVFLSSLKIVDVRIALVMIGKMVFFRNPEFLKITLLIIRSTMDVIANLGMGAPTVSSPFSFSDEIKLLFNF